MSERVKSSPVHKSVEMACAVAWSGPPSQPTVINRVAVSDPQALVAVAVTVNVPPAA